MCIRDSDNTISEYESNNNSRISVIQSKIREIDDLNMQTNNDIYDKCTSIEGSLRCVKDELRGKIDKKLTGVTERVTITHDLHNEIELDI